MKANAPERIWIDPATDLPKLSGHIDNESIEYIHTDAFIEKAAKWLEEHKELVETEDNGIMGWIPDYFIEDFKKALK